MKNVAHHDEFFKIKKIIAFCLFFEIKLKMNESGFFCVDNDEEFGKRKGLKLILIAIRNG